jgi:thioredoxin-related protein
MKRSFILIFTFISLLSVGQEKVTTPPYKRFPALPAMQILLGDSTTRYGKDDFPKKKAVLLMLFSPDCEHCQHTAKELCKFKEEIKDIHIVMATLTSVSRMNEFVAEYKLNELPNVVVGRDFQHFMPSFYDIKRMPFMAFYNKKGDLIEVFEGAMPLERMMMIFKRAK